MPLSISTTAIEEKNKLVSDPWILLLEIIYPGEPSIRLAWSTEDVFWDGETWKGASFDLSDVDQSKDAEISTVDLSVSDIERNIIPLLDDYNGGVGAEAWVRLVHSSYLNETVPEIEEKYEIVDVAIDYQSNIKFTLGAENLSNYQSPPHRFIKSHCRYQEFKDSLCGYSGTETECSRTFERCRELNNQSRFGGFPGVGSLGYWA